MCRKIDAALDFMGDDEAQLRPYLLYHIDEIMAGPKHIDPQDCTTSELMSLLAVLVPVFSRRLVGTDAATAPPAKLLTLILGDGGVEDGASTGT